MKYTFKYEEKEYEVDDSLMFDQQNEGFKELWASVDKVSNSGYSTLEADDYTITVYDRGGVFFIQRESEVKNG